MNLTIKKRLRALESRNIAGDVILHMPGGSVERIRGRLGGGSKDFRLRLFHDLCNERCTPQQQNQLDLISRCEDSSEPDGACLVGLIRCFLHGPVRPTRSYYEHLQTSESS